MRLRTSRTPSPAPADLAAPPADAGAPLGSWPAVSSLAMLFQMDMATLAFGTVFWPGAECYVAPEGNDRR